MRGRDRVRNLGENDQEAAVDRTGPAARETNGFAIASLILGIVWLGWIGSVLALVFGYVARQQIDRSAGTQGGTGFATAGIILGWVGVAWLLVLLILFLTGIVSMPMMDGMRPMQ